VTARRTLDPHDVTHIRDVFFLQFVAAAFLQSVLQKCWLFCWFVGFAKVRAFLHVVAAAFLHLFLLLFLQLFLQLF